MATAHPGMISLIALVATGEWRQDGWLLEEAQPPTKTIPSQTQLLYSIVCIVTILTCCDVISSSSLSSSSSLVASSTLLWRLPKLFYEYFPDSITSPFKSTCNTLRIKGSVWIEFKLCLQIVDSKLEGERNWDREVRAEPFYQTAGSRSREINLSSCSSLCQPHLATSAVVN